MQTKKKGEELADAAGVLSRQLLACLSRLARFLEPHRPALDNRFQRVLGTLGYDARQRKALGDITLGSLARILSRRRSASPMFEQVQYSGRRLALLDVAPAGIVAALGRYDELLEPLLGKLDPAEAQNFRWSREQVQFCATLTLNNTYYQVREAETQAFYRLARVELEANSPRELAEAWIETMTEICRAETGCVALLDPLTGRIASAARAGGAGGPLQPVLPELRRAGRPRYLEGEKSRVLLIDRSSGEVCKSWWSVPLYSGGRVAGLAQFGFSRSYEWLPRELRMLEMAAERCSLAADKQRLVETLVRREEQVRELSEHLLTVEEEERRRISRELHDDAVQSVATMRLELEMAERAAERGEPGLAARLAEIRSLADHTIVSIRRILSALSPAVLEQLGLAAALRQLTVRFRKLHPARVRLQVSPRFTRLTGHVETVAYRLVQESFHNIAKHAQATTVNISLSSADQWLELDVQDNGRGFDVEEAMGRRECFGLNGMRERVALLGGRFELTSAPGKGTRIRARLPINERVTR